MLHKSPIKIPARIEACRRNAWESTCPRTARGTAQPGMNSLRNPISCGAVKKPTISRQDAKTQRLANNDFSVLFARSATLRLCVKCFCSSRNYLTPSCGTGQGGSQTTPISARVNCRAERRLAWADRLSALPYAKRILLSTFEVGMLLKTNEAERHIPMNL